MTDLWLSSYEFANCTYIRVLPLKRKYVNQSRLISDIHGGGMNIHSGVFLQNTSVKNTCILDVTITDTVRVLILAGFIV